MATEPSFDIPESAVTEPQSPEEMMSDEAPVKEWAIEQDAPAPVTEPQEAEPATEPKAAEPEEQKNVPLAALHEERNRRRETEERMRVMEERFAQFTSQVSQQLAPDPADDPNALPSLDDDPVTNLDARIKAQEEAAKVQEQMTEQQRQLLEFNNDFQAKEQVFAGQTPDYYEAVNFLRDSRAEELQLMGYKPEQVTSIVDSEALNYSITMTRNGHNPVEGFYQIAKARGFKASPPSGAGGTQVDLAQVKEGIERNESLGTVGTTPSNSPTLAQIASMDDAEFEKVTSGKNWAKLWT